MVSKGLKIGQSERTNFVAKVWRSLKNKIYEKSFANYGWDEYGDIRRIDQAFPHDLSGIFLDNLYDGKQYDFGSDNEESEAENED